MKKLKLDFQHLGNAEILTRSQLKTIMGGDGGSGGNKCNCNSGGDCPEEKKYCTRCEVNTEAKAGTCTKWPA